MTGADLPGETDRTTDIPVTPTVGVAPPPAGPRPVPGPGPVAPSTPLPAARQRPGSGVTRAIAQLDGLAERPLAEHPDVYQQVHEALQGALADIDDA